MLRFLIPLVVFGVLVGFLLFGLGNDPKLVPSPLIGKPVPQFTLTRLQQPEAAISQADITPPPGRVALLNVWATWCVSCRAEHQVLVELAKTGKVDIYGLNYKDDRAAARQWLRDLGDPYVANAFDADGRVAIDWGVYGAPETFVIDAKGQIRYKHIGPLTRDSVRDKILPLVAEIERAS